MARRVQSPSSINTYKQCPRKYYYQYIEKLPTKPSIHLVRGSIAHKTLEDFYELEFSGHEHEAGNHLIQHLLTLLRENWEKSEELPALGLGEDELESYYQETQLMLVNWFNEFWKKFSAMLEKGMDPHEAFTKITPVREELYESQESGVRGYIDVIEEDDGAVNLMDYKTSKHYEITPAYRLQLAIYAYLYSLKHGKMPKKVGIYFLRHGVLFLEADERLVKEAQFEIEQIHLSTETDDMEDYPKKPSPLCKWSTGECDFYKTCFKNQSKTL
ncbi:MAG: PD-(D/E)XK nuclease family protein [Nanoarchaeota archaeon]|nr:PD-(D/E)XK nuclease family protein [Nanoarchaeota archaeon]